jgi:hypothetical protein
VTYPPLYIVDKNIFFLCIIFVYVHGSHLEFAESMQGVGENRYSPHAAGVDKQVKPKSAVKTQTNMWKPKTSSTT